MDVLNKFYSSVSNTVSQLSGVLPGNPVTREFEATEFIASAGPGLLWKVYKGYKKSTKQEASIFVFEKKQLERWTKADRDVMLEILKRGIVQLTKLRHPQILTVQYSLEESRESLAFAAEPVFASLANILGNTENIPTPKHLVNHKLYEVEIKYGLMQIAEGLAFLHNDVKLLHHNICPESIMVNQQGAWKIFGFDLCIANQSGPGSPPYWPFSEYCPAMHPLTQPKLDYLAPEYVLYASHSTASDLYSFGMLIYAIHSTSHSTLGNIGNDYSKFQRFATELRNLPGSHLLCVPDGLREYVKLLLNVTLELRPDPHQFLKIPYFEDVGVKTLNYLDSLFQWDNLQKSQFYKGLPQIIQKMPHRICLHRVLPCLAKEFVNAPMVPFVLPNVLLIAENSSKEEYVKHILPILKPVMLIQEPIQILLIFMQKMQLLLKLTPGEEVKSEILPMLYRALESDVQQIQELCLSILPTFASLIDYPAMKNALLPRIKKLCLSTNSISVRVNCLLCLAKLLDNLDKWLVLDEIVPFLQQIPSKEPAVLMGILGIYKLAMSHTKLGITKEVLATKVLPSLIPLCIENGLTVAQFNSLVALIKQMLNTIETEQRVKLDQLNSVKNESKGIEQTLAPNTLIAAPAPPTDIDNMFAGLGLDPFSGAQSKENDTAPAASAAGALSMEEKQRIAQQQETKRKQTPANYMTTSTTGLPSPRSKTPLNTRVASSVSMPQTATFHTTTSMKNMTQNQPNYNLNNAPNTPYYNLSMSSGLNPRNYNLSSAPNTPNYNLNMSSGSNPLNYNLSSAPNTPNYNLSSASIKSNEAKLVASLTAEWSSSNTNASNFSNKWANSRQKSQDWSQFESLLPDPNKPAQNINSNSNNNYKKINENETIDLLS